MADRVNDQAGSFPQNCQNITEREKKRRSDNSIFNETERSRVLPNPTAVSCTLRIRLGRSRDGDGSGGQFELNFHGSTASRSAGDDPRFQ